MNDKKEVPLIATLIVPALIVGAFVVVLAGSEKLFGITSGWLVPMILGLYLAIQLPQGLGVEGLKRCIFGCLVGMIAGWMFTFFPPLFILGLYLSLFGILSGKFSIALNEYGLCMVTVFTAIKGLTVETLWMDVVMFLLGVAVISVITAVASKGKKQEEN